MPCYCRRQAAERGEGSYCGLAPAAVGEGALEVWMRSLGFKREFVGWLMVFWVGVLHQGNWHLAIGVWEGTYGAGSHNCSG